MSSRTSADRRWCAVLAWAGCSVTLARPGDRVGFWSSSSVPSGLSVPSTVSARLMDFSLLGGQPLTHYFPGFRSGAVLLRQARDKADCLQADLDDLADQPDDVFGVVSPVRVGLDAAAFVLA